MEEKELELEKKYLNKVLKEINSQRNSKQRELALIAKEKKEFSLHFSDDFYYMDDEEALGEGDILAELDDAWDRTQTAIYTLNRQEYSPYFGRIDFIAKKKRKPTSYYIGVNNLIKSGASIPLVCDWRAPISSIFYDFELGDAEYAAPQGRQTGNVVLKRQYEIKNKKLLKCFDSSVTIGDEILKDVLSRPSSKKMKTIIASIQKEQNKIIRNNTSKNMLVQGVAGSGKTSIALHRVAYLLYQNRQTLKAEDVLILSPNTLFSSYIADVLPELGEENISQMSFYKLAKDELSFLNRSLETREQNLNEALKDDVRLNQIAYKHTKEFYESLKSFCERYYNVAFCPKDLRFGKDIISAQELCKLYNQTYISKTPAIRVEWIVDYIIDKLDIKTAIREISERLKRIIYPFFEEANIIKVYADFLANIGMEFSFNEAGEIRYDDLAALLYLANYLFGIKKRNEVKYLIIDEMQDYSFVHYHLFNQIFDCSKTILGDINQCIEKIMTKQDLNELAQMLNAEYLELNNSYRSTYEITEFANGLKNIQSKAVERHGEKPKIEKINLCDFQNKIKELCTNENYNSIAILTKNEEEAKKIYLHLSGFDSVSLNLTPNDEPNKICVMPSYISKGLEFDVVVIPYCNKNNYKNFIDNNLLYISSTRALHLLKLYNFNT